jgi:hypothetical protein
MPGPHSSCKASGGIDRDGALDRRQVGSGWRLARAALYLPGSIPWDLITVDAAGLVRKAINSFAASIDCELALMPPVNVM